MELWHYKLELFPVLTTCVIAELPMLLRRWTKMFYIPMYVSFLLDNLNRDLSVYYGEGFLGDPFQVSETEAIQIRARLKVSAMVSVLFSAGLLPMIAGVVAAFFLRSDLVAPFLVVMTLYRMSRCWISYREFGTHGISNSKSKSMLALVFFFYVAVSTYFTATSEAWARPFADVWDFVGLAKALPEAVVVKGVIGLGLLTWLSGLFASATADPQLRDDQLKLLTKQRAKIEENSFALIPVVQEPIPDSSISLTGDGPPPPPTRAP